MSKLSESLEKLHPQDGDLIIARGRIDPGKLVNATAGMRRAAQENGTRLPNCAIIFLRDDESLEIVSSERLLELGLQRIRRAT